MYGSILSAEPVILQSLLRDNETFSDHLLDNLSIPPSVVQSLMRSKIKLYPVSVATLHCCHIMDEGFNIFLLRTGIPPV